MLDKDAEQPAHFYAEIFPNQITPRTLTEAMSKGGNEAKRVFDAMMKMKKIDIAAIDTARRGGKHG